MLPLLLLLTNVWQSSHVLCHRFHICPGILTDPLSTKVFSWRAAANPVVSSADAGRWCRIEDAVRGHSFAAYMVAESIDGQTRPLKQRRGIV